MKQLGVFVVSLSISTVISSSGFAQNQELPFPRAGLFEAADKNDTFDSWSSTHDRIFSLWDITSKSSEQMQNRAADSVSKGYPYELVMKAMFEHYNEWAMKDMQSMADRIRSRNGLDITISIPSGMSPHQQALVISRMRDDLKRAERSLGNQPQNFGNTDYVFAPSAAVVNEAHAIMKFQLKAYTAEMAALPDFPNNPVSTKLTIPGRDADFTIQIDDSTERMRLFRDLLGIGGLKREIRMGKKGPEVVFNFSQRVTWHGSSSTFVRRPGETEVFKFKNTPEMQAFLEFLKAQDAAQAAREWTEFDYAAGTMRVQTPSLHREPLPVDVQMTYNPNNQEKIGIVSTDGSFRLATTGTTLTQDQIKSAPFIVVTDLNEIVNIANVLNKKPEAPAVQPAAPNEDEIIRRLRTGQLLPKDFDLHPLQCPRDVLT